VDEAVRLDVDTSALEDGRLPNEDEPQLEPKLSPLEQLAAAYDDRLPADAEPGSRAMGSFIPHRSKSLQRSQTSRKFESLVLRFTSWNGPLFCAADPLHVEQRHSLYAEPPTHDEHDRPS